MPDGFLGQSRGSPGFVTAFWGRHHASRWGTISYIPPSDDEGEEVEGFHRAVRGEASVDGRTSKEEQFRSRRGRRDQKIQTMIKVPMAIRERRDPRQSGMV